MYIYISEHCYNNLISVKHQSAYKAKHSCDIMLLKLVNNILCNMEKLEVTTLVCINLSAAFDAVDHRILINILENYFGAQGTLQEWFKHISVLKKSK